MEKRESRRDRTYRYGLRARRVHLRVVHPNGTPDCICEKSAWFFAKAKSVGCRCRRKKRGNPKVGASLCAGCGSYHESVKERIRGRRLARAWLSEVRGSDPDDVDF